jgi:peptide/nickel transport system substrate-binding protein
VPFPNARISSHDGRELDADDVLATFRRLADPAIGSVIRTTVGLIDKAEAPDKYTVRFALTIPYASWPAITAAFRASIVPRDAVDTLSTKPDGTGPYRFVSYEPNGSMLLVRSADYFEPGLPKLDKVEFRIIPDFSTAVAGLERGELDIVWDLRPEHIAKLKGSPSAHVEEVQTGTWEMFGMNSRLAPFDDPKVRQAFYSKWLTARRLPISPCLGTARRRSRRSRPSTRSTTRRCRSAKPTRPQPKRSLPRRDTPMD